MNLFYVNSLLMLNIFSSELLVPRAKY